MKIETGFGGAALAAASALFAAALAFAPAHAGLAGPASAGPKGDAAKGKAFFSTCAGCHDLTSTSRIGPPLKGVVGRKAGTVAGANYSPAMKKAGIVWSAQTLDTYLAGPSTMVPGSRMAIRITDAQKRADLIAYLKTLK